MRGSVQDVSVDMLRHVLHYFVREYTIKSACADIEAYKDKRGQEAADGEEL